MYHNALLASRALQACTRQLTLGRPLISEACPFSVPESHLRPPRLAQGQVSGICQIFSWDVDGLQGPVKQHNGFLM